MSQDSLTPSGTHSEDGRAEAAGKIVENLVIAILATQSWAVENVVYLMPGLKKEQLVDLSWLRAVDESDIIAALERGGYRRADYILRTCAKYLKSLATVIDGSRLERLVSAVESGALSSVDVLLEAVNGMGEKTIAKFKQLCITPAKTYIPIDISKREEAFSKDPTDILIRDIMTAMLAVNQWTLERAYSILPGLHREGLLNLDSIRRMTKEELGTKLQHSGYERGSFMVGLMARNFKSLADVLDQRSVAQLLDQIGCGEMSKVEARLLSVTGIGPSVLGKFKILQGMK